MAFESKSILSALATLAAIVLGVFMAVSVVTNPSGGIAAMIPLITVLLAILALVSPRHGLFGLAALVIWVDEFKRLAVYFGGAHTTTVIQALAMPFVVLAALNAGFFLNIMFGKVKLDRIGIIIYTLSVVIGIVIFVTMDAGLAERGQRAANIAGYMALIPITYAYFKTFEQWRRFFCFQVLVALPAAAWAIKQYYFGFDNIELTYARSGLSRVHYVQMFFVGDNPRVFGFFGSASAIGCASIYFAFSAWHLIRYRKNRMLWAIATFVLLWVLVVSTQRTALIYPVLVLIAAFAFRTKLRTLLYYSLAFGTFLLGVIFSEHLLKEGLDDINSAISVTGGWGEEVLNVSTFSDRLRGWTRLTRADSWSMAGTGKVVYSDTSAGFAVDGSDYNHDLINKILINYGVLGLLGIGIPSLILLSALHRSVFKSATRRERNDIAFALGLSLPMIYLSFIGGDNFNTNPINLQIWTAFAGVFVQTRIIGRSIVARSEDATDGNGSLPAAAHPGQASSAIRRV
jgi:hypothetical protein